MGNRSGKSVTRVISTRAAGENLTVGESQQRHVFPGNMYEFNMNVKSNVQVIKNDWKGSVYSRSAWSEDDSVDCFLVTLL